MEFVALSKRGVEIYTYTPGEEIPTSPEHSFPSVPTGDGCAWSADGRLLGLANTDSGGVVVLDADDTYEILCMVDPLVGGPVRNFYFSPLGRFLVTHERFVKDGGHNVGVWDAKSGSLVQSFALKSFSDLTWPPLKWTNQETHCCRMVQDGVLILPGNLDKEAESAKISATGIMAFEVAPRGPGSSVPHVAICIAESKGSPARCHIYQADAPERPTASKSFYKAQHVSFMWNNTGSSLLVRATMEVDDTGKNYYGGTNLFFMRHDGQEDAILASADGGALHDVQWNPMQDEFFMLHGDLPCEATLNDGKRGNKKASFGHGHRNTIRFNTFGRFLVVGGYGQLLGDTDFWDKPGNKKLGTARLECCVVSAWAPDGRHFMAATTSPRMRVDNKVVMYSYCGEKLGTLPFEELLNASWRPRSRGMFQDQDRPPSPGRGAGNGRPTASGGGYGGGGGDGEKQAYRPPGARGAYKPPGARGTAPAGSVADMCRSQLGSTAVESTSEAKRLIGGGGGGGGRVVPGMAPPEEAGAASKRNARKKKAKETAQAAADTAKQEALSAALASPVVADIPPGKAIAAEESNAPATVDAAGPEGGDSGAAGEIDPAEVEKKVRSLRKKLRDIAKLKEKPRNQLDVLQTQKLAGEEELLRQIRDLGAEP
eukprot:TRINITY_DN8617_c2_g1_i1.p1 TRINITY_DN8617_c2_g1~~TRINITY_DN8617_c2_g1_i1.p1  ORF type:complete len:655 (+),score=171.33 TRINITY_DN8617_c2_g1_i1:54-2018(+)